MTTNNDIRPKAIMRTTRNGTALRLALVYQAGIANVFQVSQLLGAETAHGRDALRIYQGDFRTAENICYGAALTGAIVRTFACNMTGDVAAQPWSLDLDAQPFSEKFCPQMWN